MPTAKSLHTAVIGDGIVGLSCALELQKRGLETVLVGPGAARGASWGNAGHIAAEQIEPLASLATLRSLPHRLFSRGGALALPPRDIAKWLPFSLRLLGAAAPRRFAAGKQALTGLLAEAMPAWRRLLTTVDAPHLLREDGHFIVWETEKSAAAGRRTWRGPEIGTTRVRDALTAEMDAIGAHVSRPLSGGVRFDGSGQIDDLGAMLKTLEAAFIAAGGTRHHGVAAGIEDGTVVLASGERLRGDTIVVAAGAASGAPLRALGHGVPIIAERGYHIEAAAPAWPADMPPVVFESRSMIVTRFRDTLRAASFVEFGAADSPPDPRKWQRLHRHAAELGLPFEGEVSQWMGARPTLPDYLPAIGRSARAPGLFYAFGHQHLGLTLGPLTGELIGALVCGEAPALDLQPFDLERFR